MKGRQVKASARTETVAQRFARRLPEVTAQLENERIRQADVLSLAVTLCQIRNENMLQSLEWISSNVRKLRGQDMKNEQIWGVMAAIGTMTPGEIRQSAKNFRALRRYERTGEGDDPNPRLDQQISDLVDVRIARSGGAH